MPRRLIVVRFERVLGGDFVRSSRYLASKEFALGRALTMKGEIDFAPLFLRILRLAESCFTAHRGTGTSAPAENDS